MHNPQRTLLCLSGLFALLLVGGCAATEKPSSASMTRPSTRPLAENDEPGVPSVLRRIRESIGGAGDWISDQIAKLSGDTPGKYARMMESDSADLRRQGINALAAKPFGQRPPYTTRYQQIARGSDGNALVRATALRALNHSRDRSATPLFVTALADPAAQIRLEAAKAVNRMPAESAVTPLLVLLNNPSEDRDVRIAAAEALGHYKKLEVARALVAALSERQFGIAWQAHRSLKMITGHDLQFDEAAWLEYLTRPDQPLG